MTPVDFDAITIQPIQASWLIDNAVKLDVLRLDKLHPVVSGNKWFKLQYYLQEVVTAGKTTIATFGGAWSNHIIAIAYAAKQAGLKSVGIIRGEETTTPSITLQQAAELGMQLMYVSRSKYRQKQLLQDHFIDKDWFWVNEGGYGTLGAQGASNILRLVDTSKYTHIIAAVGTGTMLAGLIQAATEDQQVIGISSLKGNMDLQQQVINLLPSNVEANFKIIHDYHFGGYGKHPQELIDFINETYEQHQLPLDIVYTGKIFYAIKDLVTKKFFQPGSKLLMIHSGGLQGNNSLGAKVLAF